MITPGPLGKGMAGGYGGEGFAEVGAGLTNRIAEE